MGLPEKLAVGPIRKINASSGIQKKINSFAIMAQMTASLFIQIRQRIFMGFQVRKRLTEAPTVTNAIKIHSSVQIKLLAIIQIQNIPTVMYRSKLKTEINLQATQKFILKQVTSAALSMNFLNTLMK